MKPFENLTNMNVGLNKLSQFHRYYLPKSREYNNLLISTTFTHLFIRTLQPSVLLSLGAVRYFKAHRSISFTFWTTLEVRRKDSLPSRFYNVTEPNNKGGGKPHGDGLVSWRWAGGRSHREEVQPFTIQTIGGAHSEGMENGYLALPRDSLAQ